MGQILARNLPVEVTLGEEAEERTYEGKLYGNVEGKGLLVGGFKQVSLEVGQELTFRVRTEGTVVGFWGTVLERMEPSRGIYLLSFPERMEAVTRRAAQRLTVLIPVQLELFNGEPETEKGPRSAVLTSLSIGGCALVSGTELPDTAHCRLTFSLPGDDHSHVFEGLVRRCDPDGRKRVIGVQFIGEDRAPGAGKELDAWIHNHLGLVAAPA